MKKYFFIAAIAAMTFTSCERNPDPEMAPVNASITVDDTPMQTHATITFACQGFEMTPFGTRSLEADGKVMTDLWILDYLVGLDGIELSQDPIHQVSTDEDFGTPTLNLSVGSHHVYFIASRGSGATLSTENHTITFTRVLDTFYKDYEINVTATSNGSRSVTLDRIVTKLTTVITDAIPEDAATFNITPEAWHYGIDYTTGLPISATASQTITINIPSSEIGVTNERLSIFGFSTEDEWTTNLTLNCKKADGTILGSAVLADVPLKRNRITEYTGPLFSSSGSTTVGLSTDWGDPITGTW